MAKNIIGQFLALPEEEQNKVIEHFKSENPVLAEKLERIRDEEAYFSALGETVVVEIGKGGQYGKA